MGNDGPRLRGEQRHSSAGRCNRPLGDDCVCFRPLGRDGEPHEGLHACSCETYGGGHGSRLDGRTSLHGGHTIVKRGG